MSSKTALVLAGGGSYGAVQVGMLKALVEAGLGFDLVVGASVGALNGAYFAARPDAEGVAELARLWLGLRQADVFPFSLTEALGGLLQRRGHMLQPLALQRLIRRALPLQRIEEARLPLHIVATDILNGAEVVLSRGEIEPALLASCAIPLVFPPVPIGGRLLVDGGVACNTPIASAVALGATRLIVLPTGFGCACSEPPRGLAALAMHTLNLVSMGQLARDIELHAAQARIHVVAPLCPLGVSVFDFSQTERLLRRAQRQTRAWLRVGGLERIGVPGEMKTHYHAVRMPH